MHLVLLLVQFNQLVERVLLLSVVCICIGNALAIAHLLEVDELSDGLLFLSRRIRAN